MLIEAAYVIQKTDLQLAHLFSSHHFSLGIENKSSPQPLTGHNIAATAPG
jgi:hypothetical protein